MRWITFLCLMALSPAAVSARGPDYEGVFQMGGGTACCVDGRYLVTCIHGLQNESRFRWDDKVSASLIGRFQYNPKKPPYGVSNDAHSDGVAVWYLSGKGSFKSLKLATDPPEKGDRVKVPGYGGGRYRMREGTIRSIGTDMILNLSVIPGDSGAPVLNSDGELVGVVTHSGGSTSMAVPWHTVSLAIRSSRETKASANKPKALPVAQREVFAFLTSGCTPCDFLKRDIAAGHFKRFNMKQVIWNRATRTWSDGGAAFEAFVEECEYVGTLEFPVVWVKGTGQYKAGYLPEKRGGLISFIGGLFEGVIGLVIGQNDKTVEFPKPYRRRKDGADQPPEPGTEVDPGPDGLDVGTGDPAPMPEPGIPQEIEDRFERIFGDLKKLQDPDTGLIGKSRAILDLKSQVKTLDAKATASELKSKAAADGVARLEELGISDAIDGLKVLKDENASTLAKVRAAASAPGNLKKVMGGMKEELARLKEEKGQNPLHALWGLIALITGALHERSGEED